MDKFTGKRRETWQSKLPAWPFMVVASVIVAAVCAVISLTFSGILLGDGTAASKAIVWFKAFANIMLPAVVVGCAAGWVLHQVYFGPANRHGAMGWTGLLILAGALGGTPASLTKAVVADRLGYATRLNDSVAEARAAAKRSEADLQQRLSLLLRNDPFAARNLAREGGLENAAKAIAGHRELIAAARKDYDRGQTQARAAMEKGIVGEADREAVLLRLDEAAGPRRAIMERMWGGHERIAELHEQKLQALTSNRGAWHRSPGGATITSAALFNRIQQIEDQIREAIDAVDAAESELYRLDAETEAGIDRVLKAAV